MGRLIRTPLQAVILLFDLLLALVLVVPTVVCALGVAVQRRMARRDGPGRLMHLSAGSNTNIILVKFGSFSLLFETEAPAAQDFAGNVLFWFPSKNTLRLDFPNGWTVLEQGKALGVLRATGSVLYVLRASLTLWRFDIRAIRAWDPFICGAFGWLLSRIGAVPWCISLHADYALGHRLSGAAGAPTLFGWRAGAEAVERFAFARADLVMPIRNSLVSYCLSRGARQEAIRIIPHGIDLGPFLAPSTVDVHELLGLDRQVPILSFAGRLSPENYVHDVVALARRLREQGREVAVVMAGDGPERAALDAAAGGADLGGSLHVIGFQPREVVCALRQASALSLCLMGGYSLIEAAAAGRPVIAYDIEWHAEIVRSGETGALVAEGDISALADAVHGLLDAPDVATRLGAQARAVAVERHDIGRTAAIKRACYAELMAVPRGATVAQAS